MSEVIQLRQSEADEQVDIHNWLQEKLDLPAWYGRNLDALWDCLTADLPRPMVIHWIADSDTAERYVRIIEVFEDAAQADGQLIFARIYPDHA